MVARDDGDQLRGRRRGSAARSRARKSCCPPGSPEPDLRPLDGPAAIADLAAFGKALGQPTRVKIVRLLLSREGCAFAELAQQLALAPSTLSEHLSVLRGAGLIRSLGDPEPGQRACYCIDRRAIRRLRALVVSL